VVISDPAHGKSDFLEEARGKMQEKAMTKTMRFRLNGRDITQIMDSAWPPGSMSAPACCNSP
jgi:hypothetical protein